MKNVYVDCNILIDWLMDREPFSYYAAKLISLTEEKRIRSHVSALTLANTYYIIRKELNIKIAEEFLKDSLKLFNITDLTAGMVESAVQNKFKDFEDDLHYQTAVSNSISYLITRNKKDFKKDKIKIVDAEEFIKEFESAGLME